ncbi:MAG: glycosyl transferase [candidate division Zixibacteria bacterium]|nr:glycosyl transferase [candidate division Zixibacteria bacterium]
MSDFYQSGVVSTLHRLGDRDGKYIAREFKELSGLREIALVLPALYSEFEAEAIHTIFKELESVEFINEIVLTLGGADESQFRKVKEYFKKLPYDVEIVWCTGPRVEKIINLLAKNGLSVGPDGKGRSVWLAYGYIIANDKSDAIALHDCDIVTYNNELLARLCFPIANPSMGYEFCKGFYSRVTDRMHGRVTRLFITPILRALKNIIGSNPLLEYLDSFRYPLAGEFSMTIDLARANRIPGHWGLEIGTLAEVFRNCVPKRICQVDLADNYEHKHQQLSAEDPSKGLLKMCIDITKTIFHTLSTEGVVLTEGILRTLPVTYLRTAQDTVKRYEDDALINGLKFDRHAEVSAVEAFTRGIQIAAGQYKENILGAPEIPNWNRLVSALPDVPEMLLAAVSEDKKL